MMYLVTYGHQGLPFHTDCSGYDSIVAGEATRRKFIIIHWHGYGCRFQLTLQGLFHLYKNKSYL
jgi:hypothetical protein